MKNLTFVGLLFIYATSAFAVEKTVTVPVIARPNEAKIPFMRVINPISQSLHRGHRSAIAPMGGTKVTPFLELGLSQLVIVTNSKPGTPAEIEAQFTTGKSDLKEVLQSALSNGAMNTADVLRVNAGAQILARLKLELGVRKVAVTHWTESNSGITIVNEFGTRSMTPNARPVATSFDFQLNGQPARLILISSFIRPDSLGPQAGLPAMINFFKPQDGFNWAYLSGDGLGFFSANPNNGFATANNQLLSLLSNNGSLILDYPTDTIYHSPQVSGGVRFMEGRMDLDKIDGIRLLKTFRVEALGIFGYCMKSGDEVRIYQKTPTQVLRTKSSTLDRLRQVGESVTWNLQ